MGRRKKTTAINFVKRFTFEYVGEKIGLGIIGGADSDHRFLNNPNGIFIATVDKNSSAYNYVLPHDQILSINGNAVSNRTHDQVVEMFKNSSNKIELEIQRSIRSSPALLSFNKFRTFISCDEESGCGFEYELTSWPSNSSPGMYHMVVTSVTPYGAAYGSLLTRDVILQINRIEVVGLCNKEIEWIISNSKGSLNIIFMRKPNFVNGYSKMNNRLKNQDLVVIEREPNAAFGFGLIGGENNVPVFVASVDAFTPADKSGLRPGDIILRVDDIEVTGKSYDEVTELIRNSSICELLVQRNYSVDFLMKRYIKNNSGNSTQNISLPLEEDNNLSLKARNITNETETVLSFYVRSLTTYDPARERMLPAKSFKFDFGSIIYVTNGNDRDWWQARLYNSGTDNKEGELGVIPSNERFKNQKLKDHRKVKFLMDTNQKQKKEKKNGAQEEVRLISNERESSKDEIFYEMVTHETVEFSHRPLILMGELTEKVTDVLLTTKPMMFALPTRYTTKLKKRPRGFKQKLVDLETLQVCAKEEIFVGLKRHKDYHYAFRLKELAQNCTNGIHTILELKSVSMKILRKHQLHPTVIFIKPPNLDYITEMNKRIPEDEAKKILQVCLKLEKEYKTMITHILSANTTFSNLIYEITSIMKGAESNKLWVAAENKIF